MRTSSPLSRSCLHRDDQQPAAATARVQGLPPHPTQRVPRAAQHRQHAHRPRCPHRRPRLRALSGKVLPGSWARLLQVDGRQPGSVRYELLTAGS